MNPVKTFDVGKVTVGDGRLTVLAGPCLAESYDLCAQVAETMATVCDRLGLGYVFKASFDKANRTSGDSPRGAGIEAGLLTLRRIRETFHVPVTTDIHLPDQAEMVKSFVDLIQIPAFLCRQTDLLAAAAASRRPVNVKKGQFLAPEDTGNIVRKLETFGAMGILLTERGTTFGYHTLVVDMPGLEIMRRFGHPVCFDATHSAQRPGGAGTVTGGIRESIPAMTRAAVAVGIDALFLEVHPNPTAALSDASTQWPLDQVEPLLSAARRLHEAR